VFDGHGGKEVALFCRKHIASLLQKSTSFQQCQLENALKDCFFALDAMIRTKEGIEELTELSQETREELESSSEDHGGDLGSEEDLEEEGISWDEHSHSFRIHLSEDENREVFHLGELAEHQGAKTQNQDSSQNHGKRKVLDDEDEAEQEGYQKKKPKSDPNANSTKLYSDGEHRFIQPKEIADMEDDGFEKISEEELQVFISPSRSNLIATIHFEN